MTHVHLTLKSRNAKVGPIPVSTSSAATCPDMCPLKAKGCYAASGPLNLHWKNVTEGKVGDSWAAFTAAVVALPEGQPWRHNQAGDLPGDGDAIDAAKLSALVNANRGKLGWTYSHKPVDAKHIANRQAIADANANGFVVNLSADTLAEADELASLNVGPVVVVLDATDGARADAVTPAGRRVVTCPANIPRRCDVRLLPALRASESPGHRRLSGARNVSQGRCRGGAWLSTMSVARNYHFVSRKKIMTNLAAIVRATRASGARAPGACRPRCRRPFRRPRTQRAS